MAAIMTERRSRSREDLLESIEVREEVSRWCLYFRIKAENRGPHRTDLIYSRCRDACALSERTANSVSITNANERSVRISFGVSAHLISSKRGQTSQRCTVFRAELISQRRSRLCAILSKTSDLRIRCVSSRMITKARVRL